MIQEHKDLLITDLCGRLPYKVIVEFISYKDEEKPWFGELSCKDLDCFIHDVGFAEIKPYLFPLSSMTEEQKQEYTYIVNYISSDDTENWKEGEFIYVEQFTKLMRFYHMNHLDYMGLIPLGLAKDASGLNLY